LTVHPAPNFPTTDAAGKKRNVTLIGTMMVAASDGSSSAVAFNWAVLALTVAAFVGAGYAAWQTSIKPVPIGDEFLLETDLLDPNLPLRPEPRIVEIFGTMLLVVLALYILFDRAGAWIHIPGTPLFIGELTIVVGIAAMAASHIPIGRAVRTSPALKALVVWMGWGVVLLLLAITQYGLDAIRDSALWYYGITAVFVTFLLVSNPAWLGRWMAIYRKVMPWVLLWFPFAIFLNATAGGLAPAVPFSNVPIVSHKTGNIAVFTAIFLAYVWLVDGEDTVYTHTQRRLFTSGGILLILLAGMQNRGGLVASAVGLTIAILLMKRRRSEIGFVVGGALVITLTLALVTNVSIPLFGGREISAEQFMTNITSIIDPESGSSRETSTTAWRLEIWGRVFDDVVTDSPITGFGPGPDLGEIYGVGGAATETLRNPHNSHVGVLARMGFVGMLAWAALWTVWAMQLLLLRQRLNRRGRRAEGAMAAWLVVSATMILLNAIFDPTLEGPQVAVWLWLLFGIGAALPLLYAGFESKWLDNVSRSPDTVTTPS
jgi:hypothetical protein